MFALALEAPDGTRRKAHYDPHHSLLTWEDGEWIDLAPVGLGHDIRQFAPVPRFDAAHPVGKTKAARKVKIQLGLKCNYACSYCGQSAHRALDAGGGDVEAFLARLSDWFDGGEDGQGAGVRFEVWGGEPLAYWKKLRPLAEALRRLYPHATLSVITNGSLIDADIAETLDVLGFSVAISHDGPGQRLRGPDPFADPAKAKALRALYWRLRPAGRISFNCVLSVANPSLAAIRAHLAEAVGDPLVAISTEGIVASFDGSPAMMAPSGEDDHRTLRRRLFAEMATPEIMLSPTVFALLTRFFRSLADGRPSLAIGQKCGMDRADTIAVSLSGDVLTCQNVSAAAGHRIGSIDAIEEVCLTTGLHWSHRKECASCPVLQLCQGGCLYQDGDAWRRSCDAHFTFNVALLALALYMLTGAELKRIEGAQIRFPGVTTFEF